MSVFWTAAIAIRRIFRVDGRPEGTLTLTLCVGERVAVPAACRLTNMKNQPQLQKAAVVPMAGVEPAPFASLGRAVLRLLSYIGISECFSVFYFFGWPVSKNPGSFSGTPPSKILDYLRYYYIIYIIYYIYLR